jgi:hypothetical protein
VVFALKVDNCIGADSRRSNFIPLSVVVMRFGVEFKTSHKEYRRSERQRSVLKVPSRSRATNVLNRLQITK